MSTADGAANARAQPALFVARPIAWLYVAVAGLTLVGVGVAIDAYRYNHGADAARLIGSANPGFLVALGGMVVAAVGLLVALTLFVLEGSTSQNFGARAAGVVVAWLLVASAGLAGVTAAGSGLTVSNSEGPSTAGSVLRPTPTGTKAAPTEVPGTADRATLRGTLTVDGQPLESRFLGAYVIRDGLVAACQGAIPSVSAGRYEIPVLADAESAGCGAPGAQVLLWTEAGGQLVHSQQTVPWPGSGGPAMFDTSFSTAAPDGARVPTTGFKGHAVHGNGSRLPGGTLIEAYVGDARCGVASVRRDAESWFTLLVAGPQVPGCDKDAPVTFRVDGTGVPERATNTLDDTYDRLTTYLTVD